MDCGRLLDHGDMRFRKQLASQLARIGFTKQEFLGTAE